MSLFDPEPKAKPLRPHQERAISMLRQSIGRGNRRIVLQLPTGAGKTRIAAELAKGARAKGNKVAFTAPYKILMDQTVSAFENEGVCDVGVMQANHERTHYGAPVQIVSVQTMRRRFRPECQFVIVDEAHIGDEEISSWMKEDESKIFIGLTATPWRRGMGDEWQDLICPVSMDELIDAGYLSPFRVYAPSHPDLSAIKSGPDGDYRKGQLSEAMSNTTLIADVVDTWKRLGQGLPTLVFAVDRAHAAKLVDEFARGGVKMGYCDAKVDEIERRFLFEQMKSREIAGIVNIATLTTGVDADVRCVVLARPTKSEMLFVQMIGRGLRTAEGKSECLILDHADNHDRMGFVTEIHHDRLLSGNDKRHQTKAEKEEPTPKECPSCKVLKPPRCRVCPSCGFEAKRQSDVETEDGELVEKKQGKEREPTPAEKLDWYRQALGWAKMKGKERKHADGKFLSKFGHWPTKKNGVLPKDPSPEVLSWIKASQIRWAKANGK